jgi:hypothetical protein
MLLTASTQRIRLPDFKCECSCVQQGHKGYTRIRVYLGILEGKLYGNVELESLGRSRPSSLEYEGYNTLIDCHSLLFPYVKITHEKRKNPIQMTTSFLALCDFMGLATYAYCPIEIPRRHSSIANSLPSNLLPLYIRLGTDEKTKYHVDYDIGEICRSSVVIQDASGVKAVKDYHIVKNFESSPCCNLALWYKENRLSKYYHRFSYTPPTEVNDMYQPRGIPIGYITPPRKFSRALGLPMRKRYKCGHTGRIYCHICISRE